MRVFAFILGAVVVIGAVTCGMWPRWDREALMSTMNEVSVEDWDAESTLDYYIHKYDWWQMHYRRQDPSPGLVQLGDGSIYRIAFLSHHLCSDSDSHTLIEFGDSITHLRGEFCCEVIFPFDQPANRAEFEKQIDAIQGNPE